MARIKLTAPETLPFSTQIPVRITDLNYGNHLGNDALLRLLHEARVQYLNSLGASELQFGDVALIMADVAIEYKAECLYGDVLLIDVGACDLHKFGFDVFYRVTRQRGQDQQLAALAKTGMICFDYHQKKICGLSALMAEKLKA